MEPFRKPLLHRSVTSNNIYQMRYYNSPEENKKDSSSSSGGLPKVAYSANDLTSQAFENLYDEEKEDKENYCTENNFPFIPFAIQIKMIKKKAFHSGVYTFFYGNYKGHAPSMLDQYR